MPTLRKAQYFYENSYACRLGLVHANELGET